MYDDDDGYEDTYEPRAGDYRPLMCCDRCGKHMASSDRSPQNERVCRSCYPELRRERGY